MDPVFELDIRLPKHGSRKLLRELHAQLKTAILDGRLKPGLRLPATRALALELGISRNTAVSAYELLLSAGYIVARPGAGNYVSATLPSTAARSASRRAPEDDPRLNALSRTLARELFSRAAPRPGFDFLVGVPDTAALHFDLWNRLSARSLRMLSRRLVGYGRPQGQARLRAAIAAHVSFARAVSCVADDIVVTSGTQQALDLLARILVTPGETVVAVESPGYEPARAAFEAAGAKIVAVRVDAEGMQVQRLPSEAGVVLVSPSHQFPLGAALSARRRAALLDFARVHNAVVIEDDYDGEFRFDGRPLDALQTLDRAESVFYLGTFSKSLFPALRIGFVVAPPWALQALIAAKDRADRHSNLLAQETLASFITEGHLARHVRKMRGIYAARRQLLFDGLRRDCADWLTPLPGAAGLHLAALARPGVDVEAVVARALEVDVGVYSIRGFTNGRSAMRGLLFGYGAIDESSIVEGLARLRGVLESLTTGPTDPRRM